MTVDKEQQSNQNKAAERMFFSWHMGKKQQETDTVDKSVFALNCAHFFLKNLIYAFKQIKISNSTENSDKDIHQE